MRDWKNWTFWGTGTEVEVAVRERERRVRRGVFRRCMVCFFFFFSGFGLSWEGILGVAG